MKAFFLFFGILFHVSCDSRVNRETQQYPQTTTLAVYQKARVGEVEFAWFPTAFGPANDHDTVEEITDSFNKALEILKKEAEEDKYLLELIVEYEKVAIRTSEFKKDLLLLEGRKLDLFSVYSNGFERDADFATSFQKTLAELIFTKYSVLWSEEYCGGQLVTKENFWHQTYEDLSKRKLLLDTSLVVDENLCRQVTYDWAPFCATNQLLFEKTGKIEIYGADFRMLINIQRHLNSYPDFYKAGKLPAEISPWSVLIIQKAVNSMADLYAVRFIALNKSDEDKKVALIFGGHRSPNIFRLLSNAGVKGKAFIVDSWFENRNFVEDCRKLEVRFVQPFLQ